MKRFLRQDVLEVKPIFLVAGDVIGIIAVFVISLIIRFEAFTAIIDQLGPALPLLFVALILRIALNFGFGLYRQIWRHASIREMTHIVYAVTTGSVILYFINFWVFPNFGHTPVISRGFFVIDWLLFTCYLGGSRIALRIVFNWLYENNKRVLAKIKPSRRVLIMGGGNAGATLLKLILSEKDLGYVPVGFVDDNDAKLGLRIQNIPILGNRDDIPRLVKEQNVDELIIAISRMSSRTLSEVRHICASVPVPTRALPAMSDVLSGEVSDQQIRDLRVYDTSYSSLETSDEHECENILVTGGAGFIGVNFVRYMLDTHPNYRIVVYDKLTYAGNLDSLLGLSEKFGGRYAFVQGDICDARAVSEVVEKFEIDTIVNFAAETHVDRSLMFPDAFVQSNVVGTYILLDTANKYQLKRYHQVSTDEVYGQALKGAFKETDPLETRSPYSASKASGDLLVLAYHASFGLPVTITRGSNNIGPYQYPEKVVPMFTTNLVDNEPLPVYGDGLYERDYQHTLDHCRGIDAVLHRGVLGDVYNLGSGLESTALEVAKKICELLDKPHSMIRLVDDRPGQDRRYSLDCTKIRGLGWEPRLAFDEAVEMTVKWYVDNEWWWRKIKSGEYRAYYEKQYKERLDGAMEAVLAD